MKLLMIALIAMTFACDPPKVAPPTTATQTVAEVPFEIEPKLWGTVEAQDKFEIRQLPDGKPGLFHADGALLLNLLPEIILDVGPSGKPRPKPHTLPFELVKLTPNPEGGFTMFARSKDANGVYDLRIESGPHDPRIHVGLTTKWSRDVRLHREVLKFRSGPIAAARGVGHDAQWVDIETEWVGPRHAPTLARLGEQLAVVGRIGTEDVVVRRIEDGWVVELEAFHHENHPIEFAEQCDGEPLSGAAEIAAGTRSDLRADFVLGAKELPLVLNFPNGQRAAVSLADVEEGGTRAFVAPTGATASVVSRQGVWLGATAELPCAEGRAATLAAGGTTAMWSGAEMVSTGANLFAPTETDGRRAFAFDHPGLAMPVFFALSDGEPDPGWFDPAALTQLKADRGLVVIRTPLDAFLSKDASATKTVREELAAAAADGTIWLTAIDEVAARLNAIKHVDLDFMPEGVVRIRNASEVDLHGLTLLVPDGMAVKYPAGAVHTDSGQSSWVDVAAGRDQLLQLFKGEEPAWTMTGVDIAVSYEPTPDAP